MAFGAVDVVQLIRTWQYNSLNEMGEDILERYSMKSNLNFGYLWHDSPLF